MAASKVRPRTKPPAERRDELMNAAQRLFLANGVGPTTIEQITAGADVAKGTFYLYFSSKDDVLAALGERFSAQLVAKLEAAIAKQRPTDWSGKLAAWARTAVSEYLDSMRLHDIVFREPNPNVHEDHDTNGTIAHLLQLLQDGTRAGAWTVADPRFTAIFLYSGLHGVVDDANNKRTGRARLTQRVEEMCFRAVIPHVIPSGAPPRLRSGQAPGA
jgi:AcrR family transcriptional regulator